MGGKRTLTRLAATADTTAMLLPHLILSLLVAACGQTEAGQPTATVDAVRQLQDDHVQANAPDYATFNRMLARDLNAYFAANGFSTPDTSFELLRRQATQSGVAYPKFYLWIRTRSADGRSISGAVRVAAVEKQRFDVTDFLSAAEITAEPSRVGTVFPAPLVQGIIDRANIEVIPASR
jgi:hypothetical protein